jgi:type IV pilus assembly protein PilF
MKYLFGILIAISLCSCSSTSESSNAEKAVLKMKLAVSYIERNELPIALKELLEAEQLDPENPLIHNNLGFIYFLRNRFDLSVKHYTKAIVIKPEFTEAKNNLARVYIETKQHLQAEKLLNEVLEDLTYGNISAAYMNYGLMRFNQKKYSDAKNLFRKVIEKNREDCYAHVYYGRSFLELGENKTAAEQLDKAAVFCRPINVDEGHYYAAIAYYRLGRRDKSLSRFDEIVQAFDDSYNKRNAQKMIDMIRRDMK